MMPVVRKARISGETLNFSAISSVSTPITQPAADIDHEDAEGKAAQAGDCSQRGHDNSAPPTPMPPPAATAARTDRLHSSPPARLLRSFDQYSSRLAISRSKPVSLGA